MTTVVELRCPTGPRRLLSKLMLRGEPVRVVSGNLVELSCDDCKRMLRRTDPSVVRVLHRFDMAGALVESVIDR